MWTRVLVAGIAALAPLLYIGIVARFDPPLNWGNPRTPGAVLDVLLRKDFGTGTLMSPSIVVGAVLDHGESASPLGFRHFGRLFTELPHVLGWPALALAVFGLGWCARRRRGLLLFALLFLGALALFYSRVNAPWVPLYLGITRPFAILFHLFVALLAGLGMAWGFEATRRWNAVARVGLVFVTVAATAGVSIATGLRTVSQRDNVFTRDFGWNFTAGMPERSLVFSNGDYFRNAFHYVHHGLGVRPDLDLVEQPMLSRPWYVDQLRRRGTMRLPERMRASRGDSATGSRAWLDLNHGSRPIATVGFVDPSYARAYDEQPMGLWARVTRRDSMASVAAWARDYAAAVRGWRLESLARDYGEESWERSEGRFYPYALGSLRALLDIAALLGEPAPPPVPALEQAERWTGARRAEYLADQADLWRRFVTDWNANLSPAQEVAAANRAMELARASLAVEPDQLQALRTLVAVMRAGAERPAARPHHDPFAEAALRHAIVAQRPGDPQEMASYMELVRSVAGASDPRLPELLRVAELDRQRYQDLLRLCLRIWPSAILERRLRVWEAPIAPGL